MAPTVLATDSGSTTSNTNFHGVVTSASAAAMGVQAGDGLVAFFSVDENPNLAVTPGWTIANQLASNSGVTGAVITRIADGVDDHLTVTTSANGATSANQMASWVVYRCSVEGGTFDGGVSIAAASGATLNPSAWTPASGLNLQRLVMTSRHADASSTGTPPSVYSNHLTTFQHTNSQGATTQADWELFTGTSYNPGAWSAVSPAGASVAFTCGWEPSPAVTYDLAASGATTSGGSAALSVRSPLVASGASTTGGTAAVTARLAASASGATTTGGAASLGTLLKAAATGAATSSGSAAVTATQQMAATGSTTSGGSASFASASLSAAGSTVSGGSATLTARRAVAASGAATTAGAASLTRILRPSATGQSTTSGAAVLARLLALQAAGGVVALGNASIAARMPLAAAGTVTSGGAASLKPPEHIPVDIDVVVEPTTILDLAFVDPTTINDDTVDATEVIAAALVEPTEVNGDAVDATVTDWQTPGPTQTDWAVAPTEITRG